MAETAYHNPVLLQECIEALGIKPDGVYVDVTYGGGGHSKLILEKLGAKGKLIAFDRDLDAQEGISTDPRLTLVHHDFIYLKNYLRHLEAIPVDGILADLGISSHQVDTPERGFSFRYDAPLDMRMDVEAEATAGDIVNTYSEAQLQDIFSRYGEVRNARSLAQSIIRKRNYRPLTLTSELVEAAEEVLPRGENIRKYLAPVFQALRIVVNNEMEGLESFLKQAIDVLKPGGRLVVLTYHSLEDRIVKNFIQSGNAEGVNLTDIYGNRQSPLAPVNRKPILPGDEEINRNPRARSAKLRIAEKV
jgi:16S rRNA (cytosine1402-N4)-methyltransferase